MKKETKILWNELPADHDYPAAWSYLSLIYEEKVVNEMVKNLREVPKTEYKAKDIFRSSGLSLL